LEDLWQSIIPTAIPFIKFECSLGIFSRLFPPATNFYANSANFYFYKECRKREKKNFMRKDSRAFNKYIYYNHWPEGPQTIKIILNFDYKNKKIKIFNKNGVFFF
jgi:hypothetical protein